MISLQSRAQAEQERRKRQRAKAAAGPSKTETEDAKCKANCYYWIITYCQIYDAVDGGWVPFTLWTEQVEALNVVLANRLSIILKARQIGMTWLVLAFALWLMLYYPAATILIYSRRELEAKYLMSNERLRGMYKRLPRWMKAGRQTVGSSTLEWHLANGSNARGFPTTAGDSYTASLAIVDEADLAPNLNDLMRAVKPTIDNGGRMILLSRVDKTKPVSEFKRIYRSAKAKTNGWGYIFLPWTVHPKRDAAWYAEQKADIFGRTGSLDDLWEQYPATDTEALAPRVLDKRISAVWIEAVFFDQEPLSLEELMREPKIPSIPNLEIYRKREIGHKYVVGADPAEGNPTSDPSALTVLDADSGEEVAAVAGRFQPSVLAAYADQLARYYNNAAIMVERNNHGHTVILWLDLNSTMRVLKGRDKRKGWLSNLLGKTLLYDSMADCVRDKQCILHSFATYSQLASIEGSTLRAPEGEADDRADSLAMAQVGREALAAIPKDEPGQQSFSVEEV